MNDDDDDDEEASMPEFEKKMILRVSATPVCSDYKLRFSYIAVVHTAICYEVYVYHWCV